MHIQVYSKALIFHLNTAFIQKKDGPEKQQEASSGTFQLHATAVGEASTWCDLTISLNVGRNSYRIKPTFRYIAAVAASFSFSSRLLICSHRINTTGALFSSRALPISKGVERREGAWPNRVLIKGRSQSSNKVCISFIR